LLKATVGPRRVIDRLRSGLRDQGPRAFRLRQPAGAVIQTRSHRAGSTASPASPAAHPIRARAPRSARSLSGLVRALTGRALQSERLLPVGVVVLILVSSILSFAPSGVHALAVGGPEGDGEAPRIAIGGGSGPRSGGVLSDTEAGLTGVPGADAQVVGSGGTDQEISAENAGFLDDGTLLKPVAVDTSVADGRDLLVAYTVQSGDTLTGIATHFNINMMTIWWANALTSKDALKIGQVLMITTINGVVVTVADGDTLEGLAQKYSVDPGQIIDVNGLEDPNLVIGQTLVLPGARGDAIPETAAAPTRTTTTARTATTTTTKTSAPTSYGGGTFKWPVIGGNNYISQYFHYGHYGLDIAADYGSTVVAAAGGTVLFSGWKSNGGGYQVWIAHGSGLYTTYNHMSSLTVGSGQSVGRGQQVGRVGQTGYATGPHLHFEVWIGPIWNGGTRVNPLKYL
jgi:murein DD-endopeptidase MepM/ murein hydrolase activator NlpD